MPKKRGDEMNERKGLEANAGHFGNCETFDRSFWASFFSKEQPPPRVPSAASSSSDIVFEIDPAVMKQESARKFEDLFADRQKSVRRILEETFEEEMKMYGNGQKMPTPPPEAIPVRFRATMCPGPIHDVFGDALYAIFQKLNRRGQTAEYCHWMAYLIAHQFDLKEEPYFHQIKFSPQVYETAGSHEAKQAFANGIWPTVDKILIQTADRFEPLGEKWNGIHVSADQIKGQRHKQEDRFVAYPSGQYINHGTDPVALLAVFDGHGGMECSHYAAGHFWEEWVKARQMFDGYLEQSLTSALCSLDERMTVRSEKELWKGGTTAVCCAIDPEKMEMAFAWLGDSPGYIMNNVEFRKVTREHSPKDPDEARRVEEAGGQLFVIGGELRVNGVLNLTRALGDVQGRPMISNQPETVRVDYDASDYLVLLACDGISDVFGPADLYQVIEAFVRDNTVEDYTELARFVCSEAIEHGSADNVTVVIGFLRPPAEVWSLFECASDMSEDDDEE
ncbi:unnamed protein product [Caenorhabditis sp. 36 PRJEB53466]|nr:unnamed protein product [Caenorhabditis sp. 36 PRJEB53466]